MVGFSRGAAVALLMGLRDERIDLVVDFFGPTDFFGDLAKLVVNQALLGFVFPLPGVAFLNDAYWTEVAQIQEVQVVDGGLTFVPVSDIIDFEGQGGSFEG